jgi:hypothetical protein
MKHVFIVLSIAGLAVACNNQPATTETVTDAKKDAKEIATLSIPADVPYKAVYTSWVPGDANNIKIALDMYKNWDDKKMDLVEHVFADSATFDDPSGHRSSVVRPHLIDSLKKWRAYSDTSYSSIVTAISIHSPDKNEDWVCIWAMNHWSRKGKLDSSFSNDNWQFKNGKIVYLTSLEQKPIK